MKNNTVRIHPKGVKTPRSSQRKTSTLQTRLGYQKATPEAEPKMQVVIFKPGCKFECDEDCHVAAQMELPASQLEQFKAAIAGVGESGRGPLKSPAVKTCNTSRDIIRRQISYNQVNDFIYDFECLTNSRDEVNGLLAMGASLLRLQAQSPASQDASDRYQDLVNNATRKLTVNINEIHSTIYNMEPRVDEPWMTTEELEAAKVAN